MIRVLALRRIDMTKKVSKWYCEECEILWNNLGYTLHACPKCSSTKLEPVLVNVTPMAEENVVDRYITEMISQSDGYIISDEVCWRCSSNPGKRHYMIWPGRRDESDYTRVTPLLQLPRYSR